MTRHPKINFPVWATIHGKRVKVAHRGTIGIDGTANYYVRSPWDRIGVKYIGAFWLFPKEVSKTMRGLKKKTTATVVKKKLNFRIQVGFPVELTNVTTTVHVKACPFCKSLKGKPYMKSDAGEKFWVQCGWIECYARGPEKTYQDEAAKAWDSRAR